MKHLVLHTFLAALIISACHSLSSSVHDDAGTDSDADTDTDTDTSTGTDAIVCDLGTYDGDATVETLAELVALAGYTSISGHLHVNIEVCDSCTDLSELICLTSVDEDFRVLLNNPLTNLNGLDALTSVGGDLQIWANGALTSLDGLGSLTSVVDSFGIHGNTALPDCEVCGVLDQLTNEPMQVFVSNNLDDTCSPVPDNCP